MARIIFIIICFLIGKILTVIFPNSYLINGLPLIPNLGLYAMALITRKFGFLNSCLFALGYSMICDFCFVNTFLLYAIIYTVMACLLQLWSKHVMETLIESLILYVVITFVKGFLIYCYMNFQRITSVSLILRTEHYELITLLANAILVMAIVFLIHIKDDHLEMKAPRTRKGGKAEWFRLGSKE